MSTTMNRGTLKKLVKAGKVTSTSSYSFDDLLGESRGTTEVPVRFLEDGERGTDGVIGLRDFHFDCKGGRARRESADRVVLYVHSNLNYTLRIAE